MKPTPIAGNQSKKSLSTESKIPLIEFNQILQTKSSPEGTAALLNTRESYYSALQKKPHGNTKYTYPFWKICAVCSKPFQCHTRAQARRNITCSWECAKTLMGPEKAEQRKKGNIELICPVCDKPFLTWRAWAKKAEIPTCSKHCNGILRGEDWKKHAHKGRAAWTPESEASYSEKMSGSKNPAWKGGVTYFKTHGNYTGVKYVRCPEKFLSMARKDGYVMEHRLIVAQKIKRCLKRSEVVHHINHDPTDNRLENLQLFKTNQDHKKYEARGSPEPLWQGSSP